jgi:23S rRNA-/tRNA-specific pseudouridylate synthase
MNLEDQLDVALLKLRTGRTQEERRAAFAEMQRLKKELAKDPAYVAEREFERGLAQ